MKTRKKVLINGIDFELHKGVNMTPFPSISNRSIYDCYNNPSQAKRNIWKWWRHWFAELRLNENANIYSYGVRSYSSHFFTIEAHIEYLGVTYYLEITHVHNRAYKCN